MPAPKMRQPFRSCSECGSFVPSVRHKLDADAHPCDNPWHDPPKGPSGVSRPKR